MSSSAASAATAEPVGIAIVGPTASGKTALAIRVARALDGEIVSVDSRQVYRRMNVGTAKASAAERAAAPHHGLDLVEPDERYSAGRFAEYARACVADIRTRGHVPVLAGGTGFFLRALTEPLFDEPAMDAVRRAELEDVLRRFDDDALRGWLRALDPATEASLARGGGRQRMLRALEVVLLTGRPIGWWHAHSPPAQPPVPLLTFVLELERAELDRRIDARVLGMIDAGLLDEVRALLDDGVSPDAPAMSATGYREVIAHLRGDVSLEQAVAQIQRATRQYARRQLTWFRSQVGPEAIRLDAARPTHELAAAIVAAWHRGGQG